MEIFFRGFLICCVFYVYFVYIRKFYLYSSNFTVDFMCILNSTSSVRNSLQIYVKILYWISLLIKSNHTHQTRGHKNVELHSSVAFPFEHQCSTFQWRILSIKIKSNGTQTFSFKLKKLIENNIYIDTHSISKCFKK